MCKPQNNHISEQDCCRVFRKGSIYGFSNGSKKVVTADGEILERFESEKKCVIGIRGARMSSVGQWVLQNEKKGICHRFNVTVNPRSRYRGCPTKASDTCKLINLATKEERPCGSDCADWDQYKCVYAVTGSLPFMEELLPKKDNPGNPVQPNDWQEVKESEVYNNYILRCTADESLRSCTANHMKSNMTYNVRDGLQHWIYSAFKTEFSAGICEFEIPKENAEEKDAGKWVLTVETEDGKQKQCHLIVSAKREKRESDSAPEKQILRKAKGSKVVPLDGDELIQSCFLRYPNNSIDYFKPCEFVVNDLGEHILGYTSLSQGEVQQKIEVSSGAVDGTFDGNSLECSHIEGKRLSTCLFISPTMQLYSVPVVTLDKPSVCKKSFDSPIEQGTWQCVIQDDEQGYTTEIKTELW